MRRLQAIATRTTHPVAWSYETPGLVRFVWKLKMFWVFLALVGMAVLLLKLGALSVWVQLLRLVLIVLGGAAALGAVLYLWRKLFRRA